MRWCSNCGSYESKRLNMWECQRDVGEPPERINFLICSRCCEGIAIMKDEQAFDRIAKSIYNKKNKL